MNDQYLNEWIECAAKEVARVQEVFDRRTNALELLPFELPAGAKVYTDICQDVNIAYPYDKHLITTILGLLEANKLNYWWLTQESDSGPGRPPKLRFWFKTSIYVSFDADRPGSTCVRKVVGQALVDVYEYVCGEENETPLP